MDKSEIIEKLKLLKPRFQKEGLLLLGLFGSYAQDKATDESDIDILYDVNKDFLEKYKGFASASKILEVQKELTDLFHTKVELTSPSGLSKNIQNEIFDKAVYV